MSYLTRINESILNGNGDDAVKYTETELARGTPWTEILEKAMIPAMDRVGQDFSSGSHQKEDPLLGYGENGNHRPGNHLWRRP